MTDPEDKMSGITSLLLIIAGCLITWTLVWVVIYTLVPGPGDDLCRPQGQSSIQRSNAPHV